LSRKKVSGNQKANGREKKKPPIAMKAAKYPRNWGEGGKKEVFSNDFRTRGEDQGLGKGKGREGDINRS